MWPRCASLEIGVHSAIVNAVRICLALVWLLAVRSRLATAGVGRALCYKPRLAQYIVGLATMVVGLLVLDCSNARGGLVWSAISE